MFKVYTLKLVRPMCHTRSTVNAIVELDTEITEILPYLNAELGNCFFNPDIPFLRFTNYGKAFTLHPDYFTINGLADEAEARGLVEFVRSLLEDTWSKRGEIEPSYRRGTELKMLDVFKLLPRTNCGACGEKSCMAFAGRLLKQESGLAECGPLQEPGQATALAELSHLMKEAGYPV